MATNAQWIIGYARQADADFRTFQFLQSIDVPECHKLQFLQMACEKLCKAYLCGHGTEPASVQSSHSYIARTLPVVLRMQAVALNFTGPKAAEALKYARHLSREIDILAPAVRRGGGRPDNCEYPWEDANEVLHVPLDWTFYPSEMLLKPGGKTFLKLVRGAINSFLPNDEVE
jgi:hypothetical protein